VKDTSFLGNSVTKTVAEQFAEIFYMVTAIMSGRAAEIIDLAKTNLWR
jgi:hypothetical protein